MNCSVDLRSNWSSASWTASSASEPYLSTSGSGEQGSGHVEARAAKVSVANGELNYVLSGSNVLFYAAVTGDISGAGVPSDGSFHQLGSSVVAPYPVGVAPESTVRLGEVGAVDILCEDHEYYTSVAVLVLSDLNSVYNTV
jgi:hypothetical protein